jgi:hypothetical protein
MPVNPNRTFSISIHIEQSFTLDQIWPDKNGPENPTVDDVKKVFFEDCYNVHDRCDEWGLTIRKSDVWVTDDEPLLKSSAVAAELPPDLYASISAADDET